MSDERRTITAPEAQAALGIPASTIRSWAHRGLLYAVGIGRRGVRLYRLLDVLTLRFTA
ncbi:MAG TPA: helix-turn-helix domain-containing protein [Kiloniellaceae bacterium]|nr:helix-turn-helix domain-containing protein [Kiloniellaceae bacterium]